MSFMFGQNRARTGSGLRVKELRVVPKVVNSFPLHLFLVALSTQGDLHKSQPERALIIIIMIVLVCVLTDAAGPVTCCFSCVYNSVTPAKSTPVIKLCSAFSPLCLCTQGNPFPSATTQPVFVPPSPHRTTRLPSPSHTQTSNVLKVNMPAKPPADE